MNEASVTPSLPNSSIIKSQFKNYDENVIPRLWQYAKFSGFKTMQQGYSIQSDFGSLKVAEGLSKN